MNVLDSILGFFKRDTTKAFLNAGLKLLKMFLGKSANQLSEIAKEEVIRAEAMNPDDKYETAYKAIKSRLPEIRESAINLAIEIAVNALINAKK